MSYGMLSHVHANFQNSFGTAQVTSLFAFPITGNTLARNIEQLVETNMFNRTGESPYHEGAHVIEGEISMEAHPQGIGFLLKSVFGQVATSGSGAWIHTFVPRAADFDVLAAMDPLTIKADYDAGSSAIFSSLIGNNLTMEVANGQLINLTATFIGAGFGRAAETTPTFIDEDPFEWNQASASFGGAAIVDFRTLTIGLNNNLEARYTITSSKWPHAVKRTAPYQVTVNGTMEFESHSYWQAFEDQAGLPFVVSMVSNQGHTLVIEIPLLRLTNFAPQVAGQGVIEVSFDGVGEYNVASLASMTMVLTNSQEFY